MKKIVIYAQNGVSPLHKKWANEAAQEFVAMFPEYKNSFRIEQKDDAHACNKEISQDEYDRLPDSEHKRKFIKTASGTWLVPYESMTWFVAQASRGLPRGVVDANKMTEAQVKYLEQNNSNDVFISIVKGKFKVANADEILYGLTTDNKTITLSAASCAEEYLFKTIFIHELGHVFKATHEGRTHITQDPNKGTHCTNASCIMGDDDYDGLAIEYQNRKMRRQPPFCDECIAAIRDCMSHMPELVKEVQPEQRTPQPADEFVETLPVLPHNNPSWKKDLRLFYKQVAEDRHYEYKENRQSQNYLAKLKRPDGSYLDIEANNEYHVALGATDSYGNDDIPSLNDMRDLVKYAQSKNSNMNFGQNNEPEFNARLMIACLEAHCAMTNQPPITPEFLAQLDTQTKQQLQNALHPQPQRTPVGRGAR